MKRIKSSFFIKFLFSFVDEKVRLKIIKYNNRFQTQLGINYINFSFFGGRIIIGETNGKGKEIQLKDKRVIFEGEFLKGERIGKGKEYEAKIFRV